jgi:hypothetical protein
MSDRPRFTHRTVNLSPPEYEQRFAKALFGILSRGIHDLPGIVAALNETPLRTFSGESWTEASFAVEVEQRGAYPNSVGAMVGAHKPNAVPQGTSSSQRMTSHGG